MSRDACVVLPVGIPHATDLVQLARLGPSVGQRTSALAWEAGWGLPAWVLTRHDASSSSFPRLSLPRSWIDLSQADVEQLYTADGPACLALLRAKVGTIPTLVADVASDPKMNEVRLAVVSDMFFYAVQLAKK